VNERGYPGAPPISIQPLITLLGLRRWPEAIAQTALHLRRFPDNAFPYLWGAKIASFVQNDAEPLRVALREHRNQIDAGDRAMLEFEVALAEGRYLDAIRMQDIVWAQEHPGYRETYDGILYQVAGDERRARLSFLAAERHVPTGDEEEREDYAIVQSMLGEHTAALATIDKLRAEDPESGDALNGPEMSFVRSVILVRAGRRDEAYAEVNRLLRVPFGNPMWKFGRTNCIALLVKNDPHFDDLLYRPPRL
jgi:tetratricopeptide (TPR) repeat protein